MMMENLVHTFFFKPIALSAVKVTLLPGVISFLGLEFVQTRRLREYEIFSK